MIQGFSSKSAERFIRETNAAMDRSAQVHSQDPFEGIVWDNGMPRPPSAPIAINRRPPFLLGNADMHTRPTVGVGNSSNIVVDQDVYEDTLRLINMVDEQAGEEIYNTAVAIEEICASIYIVPETVTRVSAITDRMKSSLGQFRSLTEEASIQARRYVNDVMSIDEAHS